MKLTLFTNRYGTIKKEAEDKEKELKSIKVSREKERSNFHKMLNRLKEQVKEVNLFEEELELIKESNVKLKLELKKEQAMRKETYNALQDKLGKIRVMVRVRPMLDYELEKKCDNMVTLNGKTSLEVSKRSVCIPSNTP